MTGAGGFVGRALTQHLRDLGVAVTACDIAGAEHRLDVLDLESLTELTQQTRPQTFIHAAALTSGDDLRMIEVNMQGTLNALQAARSAGVQHFIFFSSCGVYAPSTEPIDEAGATTTSNAYALSKLLGEQAVALGKGEMTAWLLRIDAVYGPGERTSETRSRTSVIHQIAEASRTRQPFTLKRAPEDIYNWLHTRDLARLMGRITQHPADGQTRLYNVAGPSVSVAELVASFQKVQPHLDFNRLLGYNPNPPARHGAIDSRRIKQELGFATQINLEEGLMDYLKDAK